MSERSEKPGSPAAEWIDAFGTTDETCPHCGYDFQDLWEFEMSDGDVTEAECPSCERDVRLSLSVSYTYTIKKVEPASDAADDLESRRGVCMCGDAMEDHKGLSHNHSPVDMVDHLKPSPRAQIGGES